MLELAADLRNTGELRPELTNQYVADIVWANAGFEHFTLLVSGRHWTPEHFGDYLQQLRTRMFLIRTGDAAYSAVSTGLSHSANASRRSISSTR
jgi:hypothetical protein